MTTGPGQADARGRAALAAHEFQVDERRDPALNHLMRGPMATSHRESSHPHERMAEGELWIQLARLQTSASGVPIAT